MRRSFVHLVAIVAASFIPGCSGCDRDTGGDLGTPGADVTVDPLGDAPIDFVNNARGTDSDTLLLRFR